VKGSIQIVKFTPQNKTTFYETLKARVDNYFETHNISRNSNTQMYVKTAAMLSIYFLPYIAIVSGVCAGYPWLFYAMWFLMGLGITGIGASVMHDSAHGAYSKNDFVNYMLGCLLNILGGYTRNWKIQHNILHHTYTNLDGLDEDIEAGKLMRMSPHAPYLPIHKYQHIYGWVLYGAMNIYWVLFKDYIALIRYEKNGLLRKQKVSLPQAMLELTLLKLVYFGYTVAVPFYFSGFSITAVIIGFLLMQVVAGFCLACIFQLAHVMESAEYPVPLNGNKIDNNWAVHQLLNTVDFAPNNKFLSWFIGGLNFQVEHHLFPRICHVHYAKISAILKEVAKEYDLPYHVEPTFKYALIQHGRMLKKLGEAPATA
jgi:linoleoyl-CoA desaturase